MVAGYNYDEVFEMGHFFFYVGIGCIIVSILLYITFFVCSKFLLKNLRKKLMQEGEQNEK